MTKKSLDQINQKREFWAKAFDKVCCPYDWKAPINGFCRKFDKDIVAEAIEFFTATTAKFSTTDLDGWLKVEAKGYRFGPAGDH